jgi:nitroreductase
MKNQLLAAFRRRHACHLFQEDRPLEADDLAFVLEAGRLSPSSFGLEQWKFVVLTGTEQKRALQAACFGQPQVGTASAVVVILARLSDLDPDTDYVRRLMAREYPDKAALEGALKNYRSFHAATDVKAWSAAQCHIAAANMMTAAAAIDVDSCAIGGFVAEQVGALLGIDPERYLPTLVLPLGFCAHAAGDKLRLPLADVVEYR